MVKTERGGKGFAEFQTSISGTTVKEKAGISAEGVLCLDQAAL